MTSWRDFQTAADRLRPMRRRRRAPTVVVPPASPPPTDTRSRPTHESPAAGRAVPWMLVPLIWAAVFWETTSFLVLIVLVRTFDWQGTLGSVLGITYLVAVHVYGLRRGRGMQLVVMWAVFVLLAILFSGLPGIPSDLDCEWGRYAQPC